MKKKDEEITALNSKIQDLEQTYIIFKLEVQISKLKFSCLKSLPKLSIRNVANQNIPPSSTSIKTRLMKLSIMNVARYDIPPKPPQFNDNNQKPAR